MICLYRHIINHSQSRRVRAAGLGSSCPTSIRAWPWPVFERKAQGFRLGTKRRRAIRAVRPLLVDADAVLAREVDELFTGFVKETELRESFRLFVEGGELREEFATANPIMNRQ